MLAPHELELLTAHVDGELPPRERRQVERLLDASSEARDFLARLEADARRLRQLPPLVVPSDLTAGILEAIARQGKKSVAPRPARPVPTSRVLLRPWIGLAAAAAVLLVVGLGSFLFHSGHPNGNGDGSTSVARNGNDQTPDRGLPGDDHRRAVAQGSGDSEDKDKTPATDGGDGSTGKSRRVEGSSNPRDRAVSTVEKKGTPRKDAPVLAAPNDTPGKFAQIDLPLPTLYPLHQLDRPEQSTRLLGQLRDGSAFRVELLCRDATRGLERFRAALPAIQGRLGLDPAAQARLKKPLWKTDYAVFLEDITPAELTELLRNLGVSDRQAAEKKPSEARFEGTVVVNRVSRWDTNQLKDLLGLDPTTVRPTGSADARRPHPDIHRPLSEETAAFVAAALEGRGLSRAAAGVEPGMGPNGYVLALSVSRTAARSAELKRFLESRGPARAGTIQVLLVFRNVAG